MLMPMPMSFCPVSLTPMVLLLLAQHFLALALALLPLELLLLLPCLHLLLSRFLLEEVLQIATFPIPCSSVEEFPCCLVALLRLLLLRLLLLRPPCRFLVAIPVVALPRLLVAHIVALLVAPVAILVALMLPLPALLAVRFFDADDFANPHIKAYCCLVPEEEREKRAVQLNRKKGRRPSLAVKAPEAPEAEASVPPELLPDPPEVLPDAPPADVEAQPQESQQEKDKEDA